jgi:PIN domain nuclease of toxin-antitoxin system
MSLMLIDTQALIWLAEDSPDLSVHARDAIESRANELAASVASLWEMAIKIRLGKLQLKSGTLRDFVEKAASHGIRILDITAEDAIGVGELPLLEHRDPFDRLIASQCRRLDMRLVSVDVCFDAYGVVRVW